MVGGGEKRILPIERLEIYNKHLEELLAKGAHTKRTNAAEQLAAI